jgi:hypothetical protein
MVKEQHEVLKYNLFCIQVCSEGSEKEALEWVKRASSAGTRNNWQKSEEDEHKPITCANDKNRTHYVFIC